MSLRKYLLIILVISIIVLSGCKAGKRAAIQAKYEAKEQAKLEQAKIFQEAIETSNPSKCQELSGSTASINCITRIAYDKRDSNTCSLIPGELYKDFCSIIVTGEILECDAKSLDKFGLGDVHKASCRSIINEDKTECDIFEQGKTNYNICLSNYNNIFS